jgi:hypothetical protein
MILQSASATHTKYLLHKNEISDKVGLRSYLENPVKGCFLVV